MENKTNSKKSMWVRVTIGVVIAVVAFYCGDTYGTNAAANARTASLANRGNFAGRGSLNTTGGTTASGTTFTTGQVISSDSSGLTLKLRDGSSLVVITGSSTPVMKSVTGTTADITPNSNITITGTKNSDGSITATSIQIVPAGGMFGRGQ